jgi:hypothetical protein
MKTAAKKAKASEVRKARIEYSLELAIEICVRITSRDPITKQLRSLQDVCDAEDMPGESTVPRRRDGSSPSSPGAFGGS